MRESQIQRAIADYLQILENRGELLFVRTGVGAIKTHEGRFFKTGRVGWPDFTVLMAGKFLGLEVKNEKGRVTEAQATMGAAIEALGGIYCVVRSVDDVINVIASLKK